MKQNILDRYLHLTKYILVQNFSFGSIPSPHHVHSRAIILVLDQYIHLTEYIVLHY